MHSIVPNQLDADYSPGVQALKEREMNSSITLDELFFTDEFDVLFYEVIHKIRSLNSNYRKDKKRNMKNLQLPQIGIAIHYKKFRLI